MKILPDEEERKIHKMLLDINTPIAKAYNSDTAWLLIGDAMQVYADTAIVKNILLPNY